MPKVNQIIIATTLLAATSFANAAEVCKVSMMGRVCFEDGTAEVTAAHMKEDAVAAAAGKKAVKAAAAVEPAGEKKIAANSVK